MVMANGPFPSVALVWFENFDPTIPPGVAAPFKQVLIRTDMPSLFYKSGLGDTDWTLIGVGAGAIGILVDDEGVPIGVGPYIKLNFIGGGVTAIDAGGGVADITIPDAIGRWNVIGPFTIVGSPHAVAINDLAQADVSGGSFAFTLPAIAAANEGQEICLKKIAGGATDFTVTPAGADTIEGFAASLVVAGALASVTLVSNGVSNWMVI